MNEEWERMKVPGAIEDLARDLMVSLAHLRGKFRRRLCTKRLGQINENGDLADSNLPSCRERLWEERKLDYVHPADSSEPRSQTSVSL
jgi:hypothetical protein